MKYRELYRSIKNPLTEETLDKLLDDYSESGSLYETLIKTDKSKKVTRKYIPAARDRLKTYIFNEWKQSVHKLVTRGLVKPEWKQKVLKLDRYLASKNPKTTKEVFDIIHPRNYQDKDVEEIMEILSWDSLGEYTSWDHIDSSCVYCNLHKRKKIEDRLYINCDSTVIDIIAYELMTRCKCEKQRYYFKYDDYADRADTLVLYCSTEDIPKFRKILNEIIRDKKLEKAIHKPPLLTGVLDGFIGYGTEPEDINGKRQSFNSKREKHLQSCINKATAMWIKNNLLFKVKVNGEVKTYGDYFLTHMTYSIKERMLKYLPKDPNEIGLHGYSRNDVLSKDFERVVKETIKMNFGKLMAYLKGEIKEFKMSIRIRGKDVYLPTTAVDESIKKQTKTIKRISEKYKPNLLRMIRQTSKEWGISDQNYAFDIKGLERFAIEDYIENMSDQEKQEMRKRK